MLKSVSLEDALRWALALRPKSTRADLQRTARQIRGVCPDKEFDQELARLGQAGVIEGDPHIRFCTPRHLHLATVELSHVQPHLLEKETQNWHNGPRLQIYLDRPLAHPPQLGLYWAGDFWVPPWDADFFFSRCPRNQAMLLQSLRPALWAQGIWDERFEWLWDYLPGDVVNEMSLEWRLARGLLDSAEALLDTAARRKGYDAVLFFVRGQVSQAYQRVIKLVARRKTGHPALEPYVAVFARLAAARMNDLELLADTRLSTQMPRLDEFFLALARYLRTGQQQFEQLPIWKTPGAGLEWCVLWSLRGCLPVALEGRCECETRLRSSGLHGWLEQLGQPAHPWGANIVRQEAWRSWLETLRQKGRAGKADTPSQEGHLVWEVSAQGLSAHLHTSKGSSEVSLQSLIRKPADYLSEMDHKVIARIERQQWNQEVIVLRVTEAIRALIGHPHVVYKGQPVRLLEAQQKLQLQRTTRGYKVELKPPFGRGTPYRLKSLPEGVLEICFPSPWDSVLQPLLEEGHEIPLGAEEEMRDCLAPWLDKFEVDYARGVTPLAEVVRQGEVVARLQPHKSGLRLSWAWRVQDGPAFPLLHGPRRESLQWNGKLLQVERNFAQERATLQQILDNHPDLPEEEAFYSPLEEALDLLQRLQGAGIATEWPQDKAWKLRPKVHLQGFTLRATSDSDWFDLQGQLRIDESLVLELGRTLQLLREYPGRYVRLGPDDYVEIGDELRHQMHALDELVEERRQGVRLSPLAVPSLAELDLQLESDEDFRRSLERFAAVADYRPQLPGTLEIELRDYQIEGFQWLAQRAEARVGACLADDMGLGKTVQALALMLHTRQQGPHLVICPTSVLGTWRDQMLQYAPSLRPLLYEGKDRAQILQQLQLGDVVIASYRILLQDQGALSQVAWNVALLDEAQFIKNPESKTARASYALQASLRIATSGTPIENRLSELWSIFRFLNPGLLGSLASFRKRFETNLAVSLNASQRRLKRLVAPFLLRRTKSQVLRELPPRTEISLQVELSAAERALYEQLRRRAEEGLGEQGERFELLAHLTRLRQACCHPRLILDQPGLTSAKFAAFFQLLEDLLAGRHRCLVFSQFTSLLDLLENELKEKKVEYLRLDGNTPPQHRRSRVEAFQQGQGDLFLISLKAGGTGLNLTGADYVVHLDPWWNPAAEDQASDRAHRLGQLRPVTIYRLIAADTIEEKVVRLHGHKRQLAFAVLEGREQAVALSQTQLRELLSAR